MAKFFHDGAEIYSTKVRFIARCVINEGGIDAMDMQSIMVRAGNGEDEARDEFFDLTGIEMIVA